MQPANASVASINLLAFRPRHQDHGCTSRPAGDAVQIAPSLATSLSSFAIGAGLKVAFYRLWSYSRYDNQR
jgi:hypothetical protein